MTLFAIVYMIKRAGASNFISFKSCTIRIANTELQRNTSFAARGNTNKILSHISLCCQNGPFRIRNPSREGKNLFAWVRYDCINSSRSHAGLSACSKTERIRNHLRMRAKVGLTKNSSYYSTVLMGEVFFPWLFQKGTFVEPAQVQGPF